MNKEKPCPICASQNKPNKLQLKQINLDIAVYVCEDLKCIYPQGYNWITVNRTLQQMYKDKKKLRKKQHFNNFLDKICEETPVVSTQDILQELNKIDQKEDNLNVDNLLQEELNRIEYMTDISELDCDILNQTDLCNEIDINVSEIIGSLECESQVLNQCEDKLNGINGNVCDVGIDAIERKKYVQQFIQNSCNPNSIQMKRKGGEKPVILNQFILPAKNDQEVLNFDFDMTEF